MLVDICSCERGLEMFKFVCDHFGFFCVRDQVHCGVHSTMYLTACVHVCAVDVRLLSTGMICAFLLPSEVVDSESTKRVQAFFMESYEWKVFETSTQFHWCTRTVILIRRLAK